MDPGSGGPGTAAASLLRKSRQGRLTLFAVTLGSGIAFLDSSVVNIALPTIGRELNSSLAGLQWVANGYLLALSALILVGGSLGDRLGRKKVYLIGMTWFAIASLACALAPTTELLVAARFLQGIGAALLTPGGLAIIQSSFHPDDRAPAIGTWAGLSGIAVAIGPFVGGWILDQLSWPWIFLINVPLCAIVIVVALVAVPETRDADAGRTFDLPGAALTVVVLAAATWVLIGGATIPVAIALSVAGLAVVGAVAFVLVERRAAEPLMPLTLFSSRIFSAANLMTFLVYGALGALGFFLVLQLQITSGFSPLASGLALLPLTILLMLFSSPMAALGQAIGPRLPMSLGPLICAVGMLVLSGVGPGTGWALVLTGTTIFGVGLTMLVAPLTAAVLAAAPDRYAGTASGINNMVARTGSLLAIAALPAVVGLSGADYQDPARLTAGYRTGTYVIAGLLVAGGLVSWFGLAGTRPVPKPAGTGQA